MKANLPMSLLHLHVQAFSLAKPYSPTAACMLATSTSDSSSVLAVMWHKIMAARVQIVASPYIRVDPRQFKPDLNLLPFSHLQDYDSPYKPLYFSAHNNADQISLYYILLVSGSENRNPFDTDPNGPKLPGHFSFRRTHHR